MDIPAQMETSEPRAFQARQAVLDLQASRAQLVRWEAVEVRGHQAPRVPSVKLAQWDRQARRDPREIRVLPETSGTLDHRERWDLPGRADRRVLLDRPAWEARPELPDRWDSPDHLAYQGPADRLVQLALRENSELPVDHSVI